jgi:hypothetical protein
MAQLDECASKEFKYGNNKEVEIEDVDTEAEV